ncbi:MAG: 4-hydroxy-tetrahydrodipicolinate synthase [Planctomycetota bacterium]|jgi:4-hydroxy-tetrahydrodipicolinate synthase
MVSAGKTPSLGGCGTALVTPFRGHDVDLEALDLLVDRQIAGGVDFLVPCGTTGESPTLTDPERVAVIERTVERAAGRVPVVAGTGTNDTPHSVAMTREARRVGADACLAVAPYYNRPTQEGLYRHFRAMIDDGGLPAVLYHIPSRTGISIDVETVARTAEAGGVVGLKETGSVARVTRIRETSGVPVLSGDDGLTLPMLALGGVGVISVASNVLPAAVGELVAACLEGDYRRALEVHDRLAPLFRALFLEPNPAPVKAALVYQGVLDEATVRLPLVEATQAVRTALETALANFAAAPA